MHRFVAKLVVAAAVAAVPVSASAEGAKAPHFTVTVSLSDAARAKLAAAHEGIVVAAYYAGEPTKAAMKKAEMGEIQLGSEEVRIGGAGGDAVFTGAKFQANRTNLIKPGTAKILINVYTARLSSQNNLISCDLFEDTVTVAEAKPIPIACKLIGEH